MVGCFGGGVDGPSQCEGCRLGAAVGADDGGGVPALGDLVGRRCRSGAVGAGRVGLGDDGGDGRESC